MTASLGRLAWLAILVIIVGVAVAYHCLDSVSLAATDTPTIYEPTAT